MSNTALYHAVSSSGYQEASSKEYCFKKLTESGNNSKDVSVHSAKWLKNEELTCYAGDFVDALLIYCKVLQLATVQFPTKQ